MANGDRATAGRLVAACLAVVALQALVTWAGDTRAFSGSDAGGRAASVAAATETGGCDHDLGYWAEEWDPTGVVHPLVNTSAVGGRFVQPATIPYVCAAAPLAGLGGVPGALVVSVLGVVLGAIGAWLLERQGGGSGWWSFVLVGVVGPVAFYGTDTWEHAPALGCAALGTALAFRDGGRSAGVAAGTLWGLAVALRTETAAVAVALGGASLLVSETRRLLSVDRVRVVLAAAAVATVLLADRLLQQGIIGSDYRSTRAGTQVGGAVTGLDDRVRDALVTSIGLSATDPPWEGVVMGAGLAAAILLLVAALQRADISPRVVVATSTVIAAVVALRLFETGFVPGFLVAAPVALVGIASVRRQYPSVIRTVALASLAALPVIWAFQWTGNLGPQWGGRYQLVSGTLLTVCGVVVLKPYQRTVPGAVVLAAAVAIGSMGLVWHVERTHLLAGAIEDALDLPCDEVLISTSSYFLREGGAFPEVRAGVTADGCRLLNGGDGRLERALDVAARSGAGTALVLADGSFDENPRELRGVEVVDRRPVRLNGLSHTLFLVALES